jgi:tripartite-type tricarboxylate transporter receptor subunit TctC
MVDMLPGRRALLASAVSLAAFGALAQGANAGKPVRLIVPFAAGGSADVLARETSHAMEPLLKQTFIIENMGGGAGVPALNTVVHAADDAKTLLYAASGNITAQPLLAKQPIDILSQLEPVGMIATAPHVLVISAKLPFKTVGELVAYAKANPGKLNYGSSAVGGLAHLGAELFARTAGIEVHHVPYRGSAQAMTDLISGDVQFFFGTMPSFTGLLEKGSLRALGITAASSSAALKGLPLISDTVPGFTYFSWYGMFAPKATPAAQVAALYQAMAKASENPDLRKRFDESGVDVNLADPRKLAELIRKESAVWGRVIKDSKIVAN